MTQTELLDTLRAEIERRKIAYRSSDNLQDAIRYDEITDLLAILDTLQEPSLPEGLDEAAIDFADRARKELSTKDYAISAIADYDHGCIDGFKAGAEWMARKMK